MNKAIVNENIKFAYKALEETQIAKNGKIENNYRAQISSFGAAITMGSLKSAVAYFSDDGSASVQRSKLMDAILKVLQANGEESAKGKNTLFEYVEVTKEDLAKEKIINAAIAIKLAMNLYTLIKK